MKFKLIALLIMGSFQFMDAQHCGTPTEAQIQMAKTISETYSDWSTYLDAPEAPIYIPVKFHRVGKRDGTGKVAVSSILNQLCQLNSDYESRDIYFYLLGGVKDGINDIFSDEIYENPSTQSSVSSLTNVTNRNRDAINIFVTFNATSGNGGPGVTLGFYSPNGDYVVMKKSEVDRATSTISHEMGHFLGLPHTFIGWETVEYDCNLPTRTSVGGRLVEYVDRTKTLSGALHCRQAADGFCDTQADYNLGFGFGAGCTYSGCAKDPDGESLDPDEDNMMGYFINCYEVFSNEQFAFMLSNINSRSRDYIRSSYVPDLTIIPNDNVTLIEPPRSGTTQYYNDITFSWEPIPNAKEYLFEIELFGSGDEPVVTEVVNGTSITINSLEPSTRYNWKVIPVGELDVCNGSSSTWRFLTSSVPVSVIDQKLQEGVQITPNPVHQDSPFQMDYKAPYRGLLELNMYNIDGSKVMQRSIQVQGHQKITFPNQLSSGTYIVEINIEGRKGMKKVVVH